jgi:hypothetical protein
MTHLAGPQRARLLDNAKDNADLLRAILGLQGNDSFITRVRGMIETNLVPGALPGLGIEVVIDAERIPGLPHHLCPS